MIPSLFRYLFELGFIVASAFLFLSLSLAMEAGYLVGRRTVVKGLANGEAPSDVSTLTAGMLGLLAFTLSLSIGFAQSRYEVRRDLVLAEANAIGTAWLRASLIEGEEGSAITAKIEEYAKARLDFTIAASEADVPPLIMRTDALQSDIWRVMKVIARRAPNPVTTALLNALNDMFDLSVSQRFAYASSVPETLLLALYFGALLAIGALGYQFGAAGNRRMILSSLLLVMWSGGMLLIVDLSKPRAGDIRVDAKPLVWVVQGFGR